MARFDVYAGAHGKGYLLDCQADLLSHLDTRVVVPLLPAERVPTVERLNPLFEIKGRRVVMSTQLIFAIPRDRVGKPIVSLAGEQTAIMNALDMLLTGF